jgi:hypothetical protein
MAASGTCTIIAFSVGGGQVWTAAVIAVGLVFVLVAAMNRPPVLNGRRSTEVVIGKFFKATLKDETDPKP